MTTPGGDDYYLISNIHGFSIGQRVRSMNHLPVFDFWADMALFCARSSHITRHAP